MFKGVRVKGDFFIFFLFMYDIQHCFMPSDSPVSKDAGIERRTVACTTMAVRRSNHSARSHPWMRLWEGTWGGERGVTPLQAPRDSRKNV
jgi:hypothetical protein